MSNKYKSIISIAVFVCIGCLLIVISNASSPTISIEPESGSLKGVVKAQDSNSSGGAYITFTKSYPKVGISTGYKILTRSAADRAFELDQIVSVGGKIVRFDSTPSNQQEVETLVNECLARNLEPLLSLFGTTSDPSSKNATIAAAFARDQARKFKGKVRMFETVNEPDLNGWTPEELTVFTKAVYPVIKQENPDAIVITGALWKGDPGPVAWVQRMYAAGIKGYFDMLSLHLYDDPNERGSWNIWDMAFYDTPSVRSVMDSNGDSAKPIASTETGGPVWKYGNDGQNTIIMHDFDALNNPNTPLSFMLVYSMTDDDVAGYGLLNPDLSKRPSWYTYQQRTNGP
jgi:hypothetical protein